MFAKTLLFASIIGYCYIAQIYGQSPRSGYYGKWMQVMSDNDATDGFDGDIAGLRIIDIVFPGSHHAGMYRSAIVGDESNPNYLPSTDSYSTVITGATNEVKAMWTARQAGDVLSQLRAGSRFLDLRLESSGGTIYAHNGLLGADIDTIIADIKTFMEETTEEIVILNFNDFIGVTANDVFTKLDTALSSYLASAAYNIRVSTIDQLLTAGIRIIPFFDGTIPGAFANQVLDSSSYLLGNDTETSKPTSTIAHTISQITTGWDTSSASGQLNVLYYTLNLESDVTFNSFVNRFDSFQTFTMGELTVTLGNTITNYPKLYFGNVIVLDFVDASDAAELSIILNYNYLSCTDTPANWGDTLNCPDLTDLSRTYKDEDAANGCPTTDCPRSCGQCTWITGVPNDPCTANADCNSGIYSLNGAQQTCFIRDAEYSTLISKENFCLAPFVTQECGSRNADTCSEDGGTTRGGAGCREFCSADYQCISGYCDIASSRCLNLTTPAPTPPPTSGECYCPRVESELAISFRDSIEGFRPGDPNAEYAIPENCNSFTSCGEENPYLQSVAGFVVIPLVLSIIMYVLYTFCCCCWCTCPTFWKKCCCKCCLGNTNESIPARWIPTILMIISLGLILWGVVEGMTGSTQIGPHLYAEDDVSVRSESVGLVDVLIGKFENLKPFIEEILGDLEGVVDTVDGIVSGVASDTSQDVNTIYGALNDLSRKYDNYSINTTVESPFTNESIYVELPCAYCAGLNAQIVGINESVKSAVGSIDELSASINATSLFTDAKELINQGLSGFTDLVDDLLDTVKPVRDDLVGYLDQGEDFDSYRQLGMNVFFLVPVIWIILWTAGLICGILRPGNKCGECFFKCTWCNAMYIGASVMLFFSFFGFIAVAWADLCWNLDKFENAPEKSALGEALSNVTVDMGNNVSITPISVIVACWEGADLLAMTGLDETINFDEFQDELSGGLDVDPTKELSIDILDDLLAEIELLDNSEFQAQGDALLVELNNIGPNCKCDCTLDFTRELMQADACTNVTAKEIPECWFGGYSASEVTQANNCIQKYAETYVTLHAEIDVEAETDKAIEGIKDTSRVIVDAFDGLYGVAVGIANSLNDIKCEIDPIFDKFKQFIAEYSDCGFLGDSYGGFKEVSCVLLFEDMYLISRAMMVIAFVSIAVVLCGFTSQYSWHPVTDEDDSTEDAGARLFKSASQRLGFGTQADEGSMQMEMTGAEGGAQPPPPSSPPEQPGSTTGGDIL